MIIACDTSTNVCSVAVVDEGSVLERWEITGPQVHIERVTPFLRSAMAYTEELGESPTALALAIGPGSFNGLRIGLATIKGLALALELPVIPIPSTDGLALGARTNLVGQGRAIIFSHRNLCHYADYRLSTHQTISSPEFHYGPWDELFGEGIDHYFGFPERGLIEWLKSSDGRAVNSRFHKISADAGQIGLLAEQRGLSTAVELDALEPLYNAVYEAKKWIPPTF